MRNRIIKYVLPVAILAVLQGCRAGGEDPGVEYAPDMYVSKGYEPMSQLADKEFKLDSTVSKRKDVLLC